jgi:hypothetical protein
MMVAEDFTNAEMEMAVASSDWGHRVVEELRSFFASSPWREEGVDLISAELGTGESGGPMLIAVYDHYAYPSRLGYRRPLDQEPFALVYHGSPAEAMAETIAQREISEPIAPASGSFKMDDAGIAWWTWPPIQPSNS